MPIPQTAAKFITAYNPKGGCAKRHSRLLFSISSHSSHGSHHSHSSHHSHPLPSIPLIPVRMAKKQSSTERNRSSVCDG